MLEKHRFACMRLQDMYESEVVDDDLQGSMHEDLFQIIKLNKDALDER